VEFTVTHEGADFVVTCSRAVAPSDAALAEDAVAADE